MKIIGLCKTFSGPEFIEAAIEELYPFLDKFVFVNSNVSWIGEKGNTVRKRIKQWAKKNDKDNKIIIFDVNAKSQGEQYQQGYEFIKNNFSPDWVMMFDTDEVWDKLNLNIAKKYLVEGIEYNAIGANMHTYIKSPFYRVTPPEYCKPTIFIRPVHNSILGIRGNYVTPRIIPKDLFFHHFTYVRYNEEDVFKKIDTTLIGDKEAEVTTELVNMEKWKKNKWDKLPKATNFHTTKHFEKSWHKIKVIGTKDLPNSVTKNDRIKQWMSDRLIAS